MPPKHAVGNIPFKMLHQDADLELVLWTLCYGAAVHNNVSIAFFCGSFVNVSALKTETKTLCGSLNVLKLSPRVAGIVSFSTRGPCFFFRHGH